MQLNPSKALSKDKKKDTFFLLTEETDGTKPKPPTALSSKNLWNERLHILTQALQIYLTV